MNVYMKIASGIINNIVHYLISFILTIDRGLKAGLDASTLGTVTGIFVAVLLPTVILLLETVREDSWDRAVLINSVINLRIVLLSVCLMSVSTLLWAVPFISLALLSCYLLGLGLMLRLLWISIMWMMDWTETPKDGIKYRLRRQALTDSKIKPSERLRIWRKYLASLELPPNKQIDGFSDGSLFLEVFRKNYFDMPTFREELLQITIPQLEDVFSSTWGYEQNFLEFAFSEFFRCSDSKENATIYFYWKEVLDNEFLRAWDNEHRVEFLFHAIVKQTPKSIQPNSEFKLEFLAGKLFELLLKRNRGILDEHWIKGTPWKINSKQLTAINVYGRSQSYLLLEFWNYVRKLDQADVDDSEAKKNGMRLDNLIGVIFSHADSIVLRRIYVLFRAQNFRGFDQDWSDVVVQSLKRTPIFGYFSSEPAIWSDKDSVTLEDFFRRAQEDSIDESVRISVLSLTLLRVSESGLIIRKIRSALLCILQNQSVFTTNEQISSRSIHSYLKLLQGIVYETYKHMQAQQAYE